MSLEQSQPAPWPEDPRQSARLRSSPPGATDRYIPSTAGRNFPALFSIHPPAPTPPEPQTRHPHKPSPHKPQTQQHPLPSESRT